jgi:hypothetical protein
MALPICSSFTRRWFDQDWSKSPDHPQKISSLENFSICSTVQKA